MAARAFCWLERESVTLYGRVLDIGEGGLFLRTAVTLGVGLPVKVHVVPEGTKERIRAEGKVAWSGLRARGSARAAGIGIAFDSVEDGQECLSRLVESGLDA